MKNYIIGIAGSKNAGKDTVASIINYIFATGTAAKCSTWITKRTAFDEVRKAHIIHFADPLKDILSTLYNINREYFDDSYYKDGLWYSFTTNKFYTDEELIKMKNSYRICKIDTKMLNDLWLSHILMLHYNELIVIKIRTLMQYFGTDICRNYLSDNIWIKCAMNKIIDEAQHYGYCLVPDVRFENEAKALQINNDSLYGGVILVKRDIKIEDLHTSEQINFDVDFTINNDNGLYDLFYKVYDIIQKIKR